MNLKRCAFLLVGMLAYATQVMAAPLYAPFLAVDINGYNDGGGQGVGPTEPGFQGWEMAEGVFLDPSIDWGNSGAAGLTKVFPTSNGNITANLIGVVPNAIRGARNRGANADGQGEMTQDYVSARRDTAIGIGRNYNKLTLSGLTPGNTYELTAYARDHFDGTADSFQAWSDLATLGGLDGPSAWLDAHVGVGASYQPAPGGVNNPIPTLRRSAVSGPSSSDPYAHAATFITTADAGGIVTVYAWADPNTFSGNQGHSLLNGFQLAPFLLGDLNANGSLGIDDWQQLRSGQHANLLDLTPSQAYAMGDLNGDFRNDHADFVLFKNAYDVANGSGAFSEMLITVPEPSALALLFVASVHFLVARRR